MAGISGGVKPAEAIIEFRNILQIDPRTPLLLQARPGYLMSGMVKEAYADLSRSVELKRTTSTRSSARRDLLAGGRPRRPEKVQYALATEPANVDGHLLRVRSIVAEKTSTRRSAEARKAVELAPERIAARISLAELMPPPKRTVEARRGAEQAFVDETSVERTGLREFLAASSPVESRGAVQARRGTAAAEGGVAHPARPLLRLRENGWNAAEKELVARTAAEPKNHSNPSSHWPQFYRLQGQERRGGLDLSHNP